MNFLSVQFFLFFVFTFFGFYASKKEKIRISVLIGSSLFFLISFFNTLLEFIPILTTLVLLFLSLIGIFNLPSKIRSAGASISIFFNVFLFLLLKDFLHLGLNLQTIGISYILFRGIQLITDAGDGGLESRDIKIEKITLFFISFLTFTAGPIQHYDQFCQSLKKSLISSITTINWNVFTQRSLYGAIKFCLITPLLIDIQSNILSLNYPIELNIGLASSIFLLYIYVSFSAYMDWMIAFGAALNFIIPENFNRPHRAESFLDLWNRWHLTLSLNFRVYVFNPFLRMLMSQRFYKYKDLNGLLALFMVFFLLGYWHGSEVRFAIFGILVGSIAVISKVFEKIRWFDNSNFLFSKLSPSMITSLKAGLSLGFLSICLIFTWPGYSLNDALILLNGPIRLFSITTISCVIAILICQVSFYIEEVISWIDSTKIGAEILKNIPIKVGFFMACLFTYTYTESTLPEVLNYYQRF